MTMSRVLLFHLHPSEVARLVVVGEQRFSAQLEVVFEPGVLGKLGRLAQLAGGDLELIAKDFAVGRGDEPVTLAPD